MYVRVAAYLDSFQIQTSVLSVPTVVHMHGECAHRRSEVPVLRMSDKATNQELGDPSVIGVSGYLRTNCRKSTMKTSAATIKSAPQMRKQR
jgi:hypothetical protein